MLSLLFACGGTTAFAGRQRAAGRVAPEAAWNHEWARGAIFYEIFVRSFSDSDGDGIGDFTGLTAKLDYLDELGIDGIWLMPVFQSPSYHGYDTIDYETIEQDYGTNADFQRFLDEARRRGIRVILDLVMNHTSNEHPWFLESASSTASPFRDWYVWSASDPGW
ncbi:MAG TPA: alpha-amylase family glycosyl hydrolase, partial [Thermoanaerobaculia bacterium]|nr:alpha-amylase family glycosyl hydrolase [Thermoanaerobaculia bacterium]